MLLAEGLGFGWTLDNMVAAMKVSRDIKFNSWMYHLNY